jgi:hypothetical protein
VIQVLETVSEICFAPATVCGVCIMLNRLINLCKASNDNRVEFCLLLSWNIHGILAYYSSQPGQCYMSVAQLQCLPFCYPDGKVTLKIALAWHCQLCFSLDCAVFSVAKSDLFWFHYYFTNMICNWRTGLV